MHRINRRKERKLKKEITVAVTTPLALGLKYLITENAARSRSYEKAILLRAIKPRTTNIQQILKNDKLIRWDHPLLNAVIKIMYRHQISTLKDRNKTSVANKLEQDLEDLLKLLAEDELLLTPESVYSIFNSLFTRNPEYVQVLKMYTTQRPQFLAEQQNRSSSIARVTGYCIGYNFKMDGCANTNCPFYHRCIFHNEIQQHQSMQCSDNPNRWKQSDLNRWNKSNFKNYSHPNPPRSSRCRGGWGRGRGFVAFNPYWQGYMQGNFHGNQEQRDYSDAQRGSRHSDKSGNKERFNQRNK